MCYFDFGAVRIAASRPRRTSLQGCNDHDVDDRCNCDDHPQDRDEPGEFLELLHLPVEMVDDAIRPAATEVGLARPAGSISSLLADWHGWRRSSGSPKPRRPPSLLSLSLPGAPLPRESVRTGTSLSTSARQARMWTLGAISRGRGRWRVRMLRSSGRRC